MNTNSQHSYKEREKTACVSIAKGMIEIGRFMAKGKDLGNCVAMLARELSLLARELSFAGKLADQAEKRAKLCHIEVISVRELSEFTHTDPTMSKATILGGERLMVCDEGVAMKDDAGRILGVASIAPEGEGASGVPTIVGLYTILDARKGKLGVNVGYTVFEAAVRRCIKRGFTTIRVDAMSSYALRITEKLPADLRAILDVHDMHGATDMWANVS